MERIFYNGRIITMDKETAEEELAEAPEAAKSAQIRQSQSMRR